MVIDPSTGEATRIAKLPNVFGGWAGGFSMAIDSGGSCVISSIPSGTSGPMFGYLDLATGDVSPIGRLGVGIGDFWDLAFDSDDRLWGVYRDIFDPKRNGLYRIDLAPLSFQKILDDPPVGIDFQMLAFGPAPQVRRTCTPTASPAGCAPAITSIGLPSPTAPSGLAVRAERVPSGAAGFLVWGDGPQATVPFAGGTLCIRGPLARSAPVDAGGTLPPGSDCSGVWSVDLNALLYRQGLHAPGTLVRCQWLGRDPTPGGGAVLSDALELLLAP